MPRILELKEIDGALWARIGMVEDCPQEDSYIHLWTAKEAKDHKASAIRSFCFTLANAYIEGHLDALSLANPNT